MDSLKLISERLESFRDARDWDKFHDPKNLILALSGETGELASLVQWVNSSEIYNDELKADVSEEMADIFIYLINLANKIDINLLNVANSKIDKNNDRYPIDLCKGIAKKADDL